VGSVLAGMEAKTVWVILLVAAIAAALYPIWLGKFYLTGDTRDVFVPLEYFFRAETLAGRLPAWHPDIAWGYPVIAAGQIGFFYPPLVLLRTLPLAVYFPLVLFGHVLALGLGTFFLFRRWQLSLAAAYIGSLSFTLGSFVFQHLTHFNIILTLAWLPWQLLAANAVVTQAKNIRNTSILALTLGLPFLAGQLHIPVLMSLVTALHLIHFGRWRQVIIAAVLAVAVAAAQLLPTAELLFHSSRGPGGEFNIEQANTHSFPLYHLPTFLFPRFFGNDDTYWGKSLQIEYGVFIGTIPLILAFWQLWQLLRERLVSRILSARQHGPRLKGGVAGSSASEAGAGRPRMSRDELPREANQNTNFFLWLLIISFLLSLGSLSPFRLIGLEPSLWVFSAPARWLLFTTFALSYFAARGFDQLLIQPDAMQRTAKISALGLAGTVTLATIALFVVRSEHLASLLPYITPADAAQPYAYYVEKLGRLLSSARASSLSLASPYAALPLICLIVWWHIMDRVHGKKIVLALITAELILVAANLNPTFSWQNVFTPPHSVAELPDAVVSKQARLLSLRRPAGDTGQYFTNPDSRENATTRGVDTALLLPLRHTLFDLPGVEWPASLTLAKHDSALATLRDEPSFALAQQANIGAVVRPGDSGTTEVLSLTPAPRAALENGVAQYQALAPGRTQIAMQSNTGGELIVRDSYYPGWEATIDGQPATTEQRGEIFRSLVVPEGRHIVDLRYRPLSIYLGLVISAIAVLSSIIFIRMRRL